jgi:aminopeptidase N
MYRYLIFISILFTVNISEAQLLKKKSLFSRADSLRGMLTPLRSCYDVNYYHLDMTVNITEKRINGSTLFKFSATEDFHRLQFDLFQNLQVEKVVYQGQPLPFTREFNAVFLNFQDTIKKGSKREFRVFYSGNPLIAKNAPWDGGFVFSKDSNGKPWVAVASQDPGASSWWPNKDHPSDEPDSMLISVTVPPGLMNVSNGTFRSVDKLENGNATYNWFVSYPINNYGVTLNIADYAHFSDTFDGLSGKLQLDYYVLKENLNKARPHFTAEVAPMLKAFEYWFGPYPFYRDGYKLIETPYLGLENQTAIAYGNKYKKGYNGIDLSGTGLGLSWDYLIVHESGHEWFGNNITSKDIADLWIQESFTTYSEGLYVEFKAGKSAGAQYIKGLRKNIKQDSPIIGTYNVNKEGSGDMYFKGANMLHTIRQVINNDKKWLEILRGLNQTFPLKTTTTEDIVSYICKTSGKDLSKIFEQYLRHTEIPVLEIKKTGKNVVRYRWKADVQDFKMPVRVKLNNQSSKWIMLQATSDWQTLKASSIIIDTDNFYIKEKLIKN